MPKNTSKPHTAASSRHPKITAQPRDEIPEDNFSDDLQSDNDEVNKEMANEAIIKLLLEQSAGKKTSGRSRAFQTQKETYYAQARKNSKDLVRDGIAFLEDAQAKLADLHAQEISFEKYYQDYHFPLTVQQKSVEHAQTLYSPLLENLGLRRADQVDAACNMLKKKAPRNQEALKEFSKYTRAQLEQARQNEKDAVDANALIMGYKALLRRS